MVRVGESEASEAPSSKGQTEQSTANYIEFERRGSRNKPEARWGRQERAPEPVLAGAGGSGEAAYRRWALLSPEGQAAVSYKARRGHYEQRAGCGMWADREVSKGRAFWEQ